MSTGDYEQQTGVVEQSREFFQAFEGAFLSEPVGDVFGTPFVGLSDWNTTTYPAAEIIPQSAVYQGNNEYQYSAFVTLYFRRSRFTNYADDILPIVSGVVRACYGALADTTLHSYNVAEVEFFPAEDDNRTALTAVTTRWEAGGFVVLGPGDE